MTAEFSLASASREPVSELSREAARFPGAALRLEPRCRVCRNDTVRHFVNSLLARGATYASIVRGLAAVNAELDTADRATLNSVRNHATRHFPVQNVAGATYRDILERRARENAVDFIGGIATAITPMAFLETVVVRGYEKLVDPTTDVDLSTALAAATRLQALLDAKEGDTSMAKVISDVGRLINAVRSVVPPAMHADIIAAIQDDGHSHTSADESLGGEPDSEPLEFDADEWDETEL